MKQKLFFFQPIQEPSNTEIAGKEKQAPSTLSKAANRTTIMLLTVTTVFACTTTPAILFYILTYNVVNWVPSGITFDIVNLAMYTNHSINFLLYVLTGPKFRKEFKMMIGIGGRKVQPTSSAGTNKVTEE